MAAVNNPFYIQPPDVLGALKTGVEAYKGARKAAQEEELQAALGNLGPDGDYGTASREAFRTGNYAVAIQLANLDMQRRKQMQEAQAGESIAAAIGGQPPVFQGGTPAPSVIPNNPTVSMPSTATPGTPFPRPEVPATSRVWGDREAEAAGIYEAPAKPRTIADTIPPEYKSYIAALTRNPATRKEGLDLIKTFADPKTQFGVIGSDEYGGSKYGFIDPRTKKVTPLFGNEKGAPASFVTGLRKEVQDTPAYKNLAQAAPVYQSMKDAAARDDRASDVNLIYGLAKVMDPGSVVRESEMTVAQAIATLPEQLKQTVKSQIESTGRLSPDVRAGIMREAHSRMQAYAQQYQSAGEFYRGIAQRHRLNEADIIPSFGRFEPFQTTPDMSGMRRQGVQMLKQKYGLE